VKANAKILQNFCAFLRTVVAKEFLRLEHVAKDPGGGEREILQNVRFCIKLSRKLMEFVCLGHITEDRGGGKRENSTKFCVSRKFMEFVRLGHVAEDPGGGEAHPLLRRAPRLREDQGEDDGGGQEQLRSKIQLLMVVSETGDCLPSLLGGGDKLFEIVYSTVRQKYFVLGRKAIEDFLYCHDEPNEPTKKGPLYTCTYFFS
jgi:hypothetical protein